MPSSSTERKEKANRRRNRSKDKYFNKRKKNNSRSRSYSPNKDFKNKNLTNYGQINFKDKKYEGLDYFEIRSQIRNQSDFSIWPCSSEISLSDNYSEEEEEEAASSPKKKKGKTGKK